MSKVGGGGGVVTGINRAIFINCLVGKYPFAI
jgi:hypothetical protein